MAGLSRARPLVLRLCSVALETTPIKWVIIMHGAHAAFLLGDVSYYYKIEASSNGLYAL
jgi:hypothetical protein